MKTYTVFGLIEQSTGGLLIAGVVEGAVDSADSGDTDSAYQRWADSFEAEDADHAEVLAYEAVEFGKD